MYSTSPSVYIKFPSLMALDSCGPLGPQTTIATTLAFAPGELSTYQGFCIAHCNATAFPFDPADMPCGPRTHEGVAVDYAGTWTQTQTFSYGGTNTFRPTFSQLPRLTDLFPEWKNCTAPTGYMGQDPPHTLVAATAMKAPHSTPAAPSPTIPPLPINTEAIADLAPEASPNMPFSIDAAAKANPAVKPTTPADPPHEAISPSPDPGTPVPNEGVVPVVPTTTVSFNTQANSIISPSNPPNPQNPASTDPAVGGQDPASLIPSPVNAPHPEASPNPVLSISPSNIDPDKTAIVNDGDNSPGSDAVDPDNRPNISHWAIGDLTFSAPRTTSHADAVAPSASNGLMTGLAGHPLLAETTASPGQDQDAQAPGIIMIGGSSLHPGGPAASISGTVISLASSHIVIGTSTMTLPSAIVAPEKKDPQPPAIFSLAGQTYRANPSGFEVGGAILLPGSSPVYISGTPVSLGSSQLIIGASTIPLPNPTPTSIPTSYITMGGETITAGSSGILIADSTLTPGAAITVNGNLISLGSSMLVVGSQTKTFAPIQTTSPDAETSGSGAPDVGALIISGVGAGNSDNAFQPFQTGSQTVPLASKNGSGTLPFTGSGTKERGLIFLQGHWTVAWLVITAICSSWV